MSEVRTVCLWNANLTLAVLLQMTRCVYKLEQCHLPASATVARCSHGVRVFAPITWGGDGWQPLRTASTH
jgi:hypothetical protein